MHQHGPTDLTGPVRGTNTWWQGRDAPPDEPPPEGIAPPDEGLSSRKPRSARKPAPIRRDLVDRVRAEIAAGTYDTPEKWQAALDRLLDRLAGE